jgi:hypothetical protein
MFLRPYIAVRKNTALAIGMLVFLFNGCTTNYQALLRPSELQTAYQRAVVDMATAEYHEICKNLTALTPMNPDLIWQGYPGKSRLLIVTWTDYPGYGDHIDRSVEIPIYAWVTAAPELQNFCKASTLGHHALILRLEQLLGLPPNSGRKRFVEL